MASVECEYRIFHTHSLKRKTCCASTSFTRLKQKCNVSVAEVEHQDLWQFTTIAIVTVSSSRKAAERELDHAIKFLDSFPEWERVHTNI